MSEKNIVQVDGHKDLPLHCPNSQAASWNLHPRVFLDVTSTGQAKCPYCGTQYQLIPGTAPHGH
ncbi:zinc-finger domain-containing protein [Polynucleobacter sp. 30F-ANTBAC]|jgi:uncharacterized Zn-finger protein|uniref:zinc-finger domain-containing protein n=1 Tax=Polynucleobacter sp. 30F-ANTBAC TaxID=2689095 RepID=UPI001C0D8DDA|nr:zinc-finger domain-containing protein [Polynucleobacter sp. 30F-ANTBAC]MBU3600269.1 zinc-finger domain-containing protein [Polynucleobacter sp. 30F-ANTBAC]